MRSVRTRWGLLAAMCVWLPFGAMAVGSPYGGPVLVLSGAGGAGEGQFGMVFPDEGETSFPSDIAVDDDHLRQFRKRLQDGQKTGQLPAIELAGLVRLHVTDLDH